MDLETVVSRYDRQELIVGWNQQKLSDATIAIVGSGMLGQYAALSAGALGFGTLEIYDTGHATTDSELLLSEADEGESRAHAISELVAKLNPLVSPRGITFDMSHPSHTVLLGKPDVILECTNNPASKIALLQYAAKHSIPVVSMSATENLGAVGCYNPNNEGDSNFAENILFTESAGHTQGTIPSQAIAALGVDEARKFLMPLPGESVLEDIAVYNLNSSERFSYDCDVEITDVDLSDKTVLMIGAGALGNFAGAELVLNGIGKLIIADNDDIEQTNLNRQVFFYGDVGKMKADALVDKFKKINPAVAYETRLERIGPEHEALFAQGDIDVIVDTVDNNKTRALLNYFASKYDVPLISGGTRYNSGQVVVYKPGETACLNCQADIEKLALDAYQPQSCIHAAQPSVITSNQVIGALMMGEIRTILAPEAYGKPIHSVLKYISEDDFRVGALPTQESCECHTDTDLLDKWMDKMGHIYDGS